VIANNCGGDIFGKGLNPPEGYSSISKFMGIPVIDRSRVTMVVGLANKDADYTENDVQQVTLLMRNLWQILMRKRAEKDLIESEKRFRSYFEIPLAGIAIVTPDLKWVHVNEKFCEILGYSVDELISLSWKDLIPEEDWRGASSSLSQDLSGGKQPLTFRKRLLKKDGSGIDVEVSAMSVRNETGEVDYIVALVNDVTGQKRTEKELLESNEQMSNTLEELRVTHDSLNTYCQRLEREEQVLQKSEAEFRAMVESAPCLLLLMNKEGKITYVSPRSLPFTGYNPKEFQELGFDIIQESDESRIKDAIIRGIKSRTRFENLEIQIKKKGGGTWYGSASMEPLHNDKGDLTGFLMQIVDISSLKEAECDILQGRERLRGIMENLNDVVFSIDKEGKVIYSSPVVTQTFGYRPEEINGRMFADLLLPEDANELLHKYAAFGTGDMSMPLVFEARVLTKGDQARWCRISLRPIEEEGRFSGCTGIASDIHDQKIAIEAMCERDSLLQEMINAIPVGIALVEDGSFLSVNDSLCRMTGFTREELAGKSIRCLYPATNEFEQVDESVASRSGEMSKETMTGKWIRKDGSEITVLIRSSPIRHRDRSSQFVFTVMDVTEQENQKAESLKYGLLMSAFVDAIPIPAFFVGKGGEILVTNKAFRENYVDDSGQSLGTSIGSLIDNEIIRTLMARVDDAISMGKRSRFEIEHDPSPLIVDICPVCDSQGTFSCATVSLIDISDQRKVQETLIQYNRKISLLSRVIHHDVEPLLDALGRYLDLIREQTEDPLVHTYIHKEERNLDALENVLAFIEDFQTPGMRSPVWQNLNTVVKKVAGILDLRDVTIYLDCDGLVVLADPLFERVLSLLLENSLRHGGKVTRISFSYRKEGDGISSCAR